MDVFLVPLGRRGYELYCEAEDHAAAAGAEDGPGIRQRMSAFFRRTLAFLERERQARRSRRAAKTRRTLVQRVRDRVLGWLAERVAEQRLLWQLRTAADATAHYPDDLPEAEAAAIVQRSLRVDAARHLRWGAIDLLGLALSTPLAVFPGPNLPGYYFTFRVVGHTLSYFGARHGLAKVQWRYVPSRPLADLRELAHVSGDARAARAREVASRLALSHLERFVERLLLGYA